MLVNIHKILVATLFSVFIYSGFAQVTIRIVSLPANTPHGATIYFAGNICNWNGGHEQFKLLPDSTGVPVIVIPEGKGKVEFKFTMGSWNLVEAGQTNEDIDNRSFSFSGNPQSMDLTIHNWKETPQSTASVNVQWLSTNLSIPPLNTNRRIWLYLPPDYTTSAKRYPVIYMQDGQNIFDATTSFAGEWAVDETLDSLHAVGDYGAIVVGIDNGGAARVDEYSPWHNPDYGGGKGDAYIEFIVHTLKPYIDSNYRTLQEPENNCLFGSSLGALISMYGAIKYPLIFGKVGSFSPAYWFSSRLFSQYISEHTGVISNLKVQHTAGQKESATMESHIQSLLNQLYSKGLPRENASIKMDADGSHSEAYWRREFGQAYQWLFSHLKTTAAQKEF